METRMAYTISIKKNCVWGKYGQWRSYDQQTLRLCLCFFFFLSMWPYKITKSSDLKIEGAHHVSIDVYMCIDYTILFKFKL